MADPSLHRDRSTTGTPLWVKVSGIIALVVILLLVVLLLFGGAGHGPGRHTPSAGVGGHQPPAGGHAP
jgi:hypothetical protein